MSEQTVDLTDTDQPDAPEPQGSPWHDLDAYIRTQRLGGLHLSPDGEWLLLQVSAPNDDATGHVSSLWRVPTRGDGRPVRLTRGVEGESAAAILRDGSVVFTAKRSLPKGSEGDSEDDTALWLLPAGGGEAYVMARRLGGWEGVLAARDADTLVCPIRVHRGLADLADDAKRRKERKERKVNAILHTGVPVRYWDHDLGSETVRFLAVDLPEGERQLSRDDFHVVSADHGPGLSPDALLADDGSFVVTGLRVAETRGFQRSTIVRVDRASGELAPIADEAGVDWEAGCLSRDGRLLVAVRDQVATAEQIFQQELWLLDLASGERRALCPDWDRWGHPVAFSPDAATVYATADEDGECPIFAISVADGSVKRLTDHGAFSSVRLSDDGSTLFALRSAWDDPGSVWAIDTATGDARRLASPVQLPPLPGRLERVETTTADGARVPGWLCLPEGASDASPAPLALWVHGGPLNSWNAWSWRWCPWLLVSRGYAVLLPDPALSTGYGLDFIRRGWGRWGAEPYTDVMALTEAIEARGDVDAERPIMMGGSFGGYMANWIATQTDHFAAIVTHASLWNLTQFGGTTDAPWYWDIELSPEMQREFSPHRYADRITTPMLVVHGDKDYRVPIGEGLALWWELNRLWTGEPAELPHRFLYFPDENHWILTPQHARVWYDTVIEFLGTHRERRAFTPPELL